MTSGTGAIGRDRATYGEARIRSATPPPPPASTRAFALVWLACASACLSLGAAIAIVPRFVAGPLGGDEVAVGVAIGAFAVGACLVRPWAGRQADLRGRRAVVLGGTLTMAVAGLLHLLPLGLGGLVAARVLLGVGEGAVFTAGAAWAVDLAPAERRGRLLGLFGLTVWLGLALGPLAGEAAFALGGFAAVWVLSAATPAVGALLVLRLPGGRPARAASPGRRELLPRAARRPGAAIALAATGYAALASLAVLLLEGRGVQHATTVFTAFGVAVVASRLVLGGLPDRLGARRCAAGAGLAEAAGLAIIALAPSLPVALLGSAVLGVGFSTVYPALALLAVDGVAEDRRGAVLGAFTACFDVGVGLGAPLAGVVAAVAGAAAGLGLGVVCALGAAVVAAGRLPAVRRVRPQAAPAAS